MATDRRSPHPLFQTSDDLLGPSNRAPRFRLEPSLAHTGLFDGAWWPRSRRLDRELPALIAALRPAVGPVLHVGVERGAWDDIPDRVMADGRVVRVNCFSSSCHTMSVGGGHQDHFLLLVVPPRTRKAVAAAAMLAASRPGNSATALRTLRAAGLAPVARGPRDSGLTLPTTWPPPWPPPLPPAPQPLPPLPPLPE